MIMLLRVIGLSLLLAGIAPADSLNCRLVGHCDTPGEAFGVALAGSYAYVADGNYGLQVIQFYGGGVEETPNAEVRTPNAGATIVRGSLRMAGSPSASSSPSRLLDATGRVVMALKPGENDVSGLAPGVYFVRQEAQAHAQAQAVTKVIVTR